MELQLTQDERDLLERTLRYQLGELRMEIADTDSSTFREGLYRDEELMKALLGRLEAPIAGRAPDARE